jgi:hypothetical protein
MTALGSYLQAHWLDWLSGAVAAVLVWISARWWAAPLQEFLADRRHAIEAIQEHGYRDPFLLASEESVKAARHAIGTAATRMLFYAQGGPGIVRLYCRLRGYDLHLAGRTLNGLASIIASGHRAPDYQRDAARLCLGATRLISRDRQRAVRFMLQQALLDEQGVLDPSRIPADSGGGKK